MSAERKNVGVDEPNREEYKCEQCESSFGRKGILARHKRMEHTLQKCVKCNFSSYNTYELGDHMMDIHPPDNYNGKKQMNFIKQTFKVDGVKHPLTVLNNYEGEIKKILKKLLKEKPISAHIIMKVRKRRFWKGEQVAMDEEFLGRGVAIRCNDEIGNVYVGWRENIMKDLEAFHYPRVWVIERVVNLKLYTGGFYFKC